MHLVRDSLSGVRSVNAARHFRIRLNSDGQQEKMEGVTVSN